MFGFSKKRRAGSSKGTLERGGPVIAVALLEGDSFPVDAFLKQAADTRIAGKAVSGINRGEGDVFGFEEPMLSKMTPPFANDAFRVLWRGACDCMKMRIDSSGCHSCG
jgi:hypothetical protein